MQIDPMILDALNDSIDEHEQTKAMSEKILKWFESVVAGNEEVENNKSSFPRVERLLELIELNDEQLR